MPCSVMEGTRSKGSVHNTSYGWHRSVVSVSSIIGKRGTARSSSHRSRGGQSSIVAGNHQIISVYQIQFTLPREKKDGLEISSDLTEGIPRELNEFCIRLEYSILHNRFFQM